MGAHGGGYDLKPDSFAAQPQQMNELALAHKGKIDGWTIDWLIGWLAGLTYLLCAFCLFVTAWHLLTWDVGGSLFSGCLSLSLSLLRVLCSSMLC